MSQNIYNLMTKFDWKERIAQHVWSEELDHQMDCYHQYMRLCKRKRSVALQQFSGATKIQERISDYFSLYLWGTIDNNEMLDGLLIEKKGPKSRPIRETEYMKRADKIFDLILKYHKIADKTERAMNAIGISERKGPKWFNPLDAVSTSKNKNQKRNQAKPMINNNLKRNKNLKLAQIKN